MVEGDLGRRLCLVVGGRSRDRLVAELRRITVDYQMRVVRCESVYTATAELVREGAQPALVIGSLRELAAEQGRFFALATRNRARCCAVLDRTEPAKPDTLLVAVRGGAAVVADVADVRSVIDGWLGEGARRPDGLVLADEEYRATEAELKALLGQESDDQAG